MASKTKSESAKDQAGADKTGDPKPLGGTDFQSQIAAIAAGIKALTEAGMSGTEAGKLAYAVYAGRACE